MTAKRRRPAHLPPVLAPQPLRVPSALREQGACDGTIVDHYDEASFELAKAVCSGCLVRATCLGYAMAHEEFGVWGGLTPDERDAIRGSKLPYTFEQRREAERLRELLTRRVALADIASEYGVNLRTVDRSVAAFRKRRAS